MDLRQLAVTERLLVCRRGNIGVKVELYVEDGANQALGRAEGCEDDGGRQRLRGKLKLDGDILLRLLAVSCEP